MSGKSFREAVICRQARDERRPGHAHDQRSQDGERGERIAHQCTSRRSREYVWTDDGLADSARNKAGLDEVEQALYAPDGLRFERRIGDLLLVVMCMYGGKRAGDRGAV